LQPCRSLSGPWPSSNRSSTKWSSSRTRARNARSLQRCRPSTARSPAWSSSARPAQLSSVAHLLSSAKQTGPGSSLLRARVRCGPRAQATTWAWAGILQSRLGRKQAHAFVTVQHHPTALRPSRPNKTLAGRCPNPRAHSSSLS
jgi:hypothetical protein